MNFNCIIKTGLVAVAAMVSLSSFSQDLIARQAPIDKKLKSVDSLALQKQIRAEQSEYPAVQVLSGVQGMGFQIVHRLFDFLKIPDSAFQFCLARPTAALLVAEVEVVHQQIRKRGLLCLFQSVQKNLLLFSQVCDPALQPTNCAADGLHQAVGLKHRDKVDGHFLGKEKTH